MIKDTTFEKALTISIIVHLAVLGPWPGFRFLKHRISESQKSSPEIVVYNYKIKQEMPEVKNLPGKKNKPQHKSVKMMSAQEKRPQQEVKEKKNEEVREKKFQVHPGPQGMERQAVEVKNNEIVSLSENLNTKTVSSAVLNYYRAIREEIKKRAYYYRPQIEGKGVVTVIFTLSRDGILRDLTVDNVSSTSQDVFRQAALKSIKYASPFPPFPPELKNDYITFSITIEFNLGGKL